MKIINYLKTNKRYRANTLPALVLVLLTIGCAPTPFVVTPITAEPSATFLPSKFVWYDLFAEDPVGAMSFYAGLLGWSFEDKDGYIVIKNGSRAIGGIVQVEDAEADRASARWIPSLSVVDVDQAAQRIVERGGTIQEGPGELANRGRFALISDPQGAPLVLLRSASGDPPDRAIEPGDWSWTELWANDPSSSLEFYRFLAGYDSLPVGDAANPHYWLLHRNAKFRAGLMAMPIREAPTQWMPGVRVADLRSVLNRVEVLGGEILIRPGDPLSDGTAALIVDPAGAAMLLEQWPAVQRG